MTDRRDFLRTGAGAAAALAFAGALPRGLGAMGAGGVATAPVAMPPQAAVNALVAAALEAARGAGATYADVRVQRQRQNFVFTREQQIQNVVDTDSIGAGIRALVDGCWGFAATQQLTTDAVAAAAREAVAVAKASRVARDRAVELAPAPAHRDVDWKGHFTTDPFEISIEEKVDLLLRTNAAAMKAANVRFVTSGLFFVKEERTFGNTDGSTITQTNVRTWPLVQITAVAPDASDFQNRGNVVPPMGRGWEYVLESDLPGNAAKWGEEAAQKLGARPVDVGRYDLVLHPSHLWLTIHESIGHPTELDRAMGYEANYAGTSFVAPPEEMLGKLKYGPAFMNVQGDRSQVGGLSTVGYDDEGVKPEDFLIVRNGMFNDYQTTREQAPWLAWWYRQQGREPRSHGCSYAQGWSDVQFQRMPNVSLLPGDAERSFDDLVAGTDRGIAIVGDGSFSIDQQRYNAQFGGQLFYEIRGGKVTGMLKDVAYQMRTSDFWNAMDAIGGRQSYELHGSFFDGKGQPGQVNAVSHGCPPTRHRQINVINTGRKA